MKQKYFFSLSFFLLTFLSAHAQVQIQNGSMDQWTGFNLQRPEDWSTREHALGIKNNKWAFKETRPEYVHSGTVSVRLVSDTTTTLPGLPDELVHLPSAAIRLLPGLISYGRLSYVNGKLVNSGLPIYGRPVSFSLYARIYHPVTDTATLRIVLTRWNPTRHYEDTLANERRNIFPDSTVMSQFAMYIDTIHYLMDGEADTARVVISGGRPGDIGRIGNTTWIDDMSFTYPSGQIVHPDLQDEVFLYPNPATTQLHIKADPDLFGYTVIFIDLAGINIKQVTLDDGSTTIDVSDMHDGHYCYTVLDRDGETDYEGNINIMKNRQ
jgi:hypothetical protein